MEINANNYKDVLLAWLEGELTPAEMLQAEAYILVNEEAAKEWKLLQLTRLQPEPKIFFPKKHLLMREEEVVIAPIVAIETTQQEAVVRTISGGFNYRKFAIPMSIAAGLLLFFLLFTNRNTIQNNHNNAVANIEKPKAEAEKNKNNTKTGIAAGKENERDIDKNITANNIIEKTVSQQEEANKKSIRHKAAVKEKKEYKAFLAKDIYAKNNSIEKNTKQEQIALVKIEPVILANNSEIRNTTHPKKSLTRQNQERVQWQKALEEKENALVDAQNEETERGVLGSLIHFFTKNVQIKKRTENDINYYAFRLETQKITIVKTFKSTF